MVMVAFDVGMSVGGGGTGKRENSVVRSEGDVNAGGGRAR